MHLIFDFDGTIVDSFDKVIEKFNVLADQFHFRKTSPNEFLQLKDLDSHALIKYFEISFFKLPIVLYFARKEIQSEMAHMQSFSNLPQIIQCLHQAHFKLGILSSNSSQNVIEWLKLNNLNSFFDFIHGDSGYFGKNRQLKKILKKYKINPLQAYYIGDETRDIDAAKDNGIYSIATTWGFNSEKILLAHQPNYIARKPDDLLAIFGLPA